MKASPLEHRPFSNWLNESKVVQKDMRQRKTANITEGNARGSSTNQELEEAQRADNEGNTETMETTGSPDAQVSKEERFGMKRSWGIWASISMNVGSMIGSGIFVSPKGVLTYSGSIGLSLVIWASCGVIVMLAALCFAELATVIRASSGEFIFLKTAYGGALAFMYGFVVTLVIKPSGIATLALICSSYILSLFFNDNCGSPPIIAVKLLAITLVTFVTAYNIASATAGKAAQQFFVVAKLLGLAIVVVGGLVMLAQGYTQNFATAFEGTTTSPGNIVLAFYSCYFSYDGWQSVTIIAGEVKNPTRNVPLSMFGAILITIFVYVMANVSYYTVLTKDVLLASPDVALTWAQQVMPSYSWLMAVVVALSAYGTINGNGFSVGRLIYKITCEGNYPSVLRLVHVHRLTPLTGILMNAIFTIIWIIPSDIQAVLDMLGFINWTINGLVFFALIVLRFTHKDAPRPFKVPIILPCLMTILSIFFVLTPLIEDLHFEYIFGLLMFVGCLIFYFPFVYFKWSLPGMDSFTTAAQLFFKAAPSDIEY